MEKPEGRPKCLQLDKLIFIGLKQGRRKSNVAYVWKQKWEIEGESIHCIFWQLGKSHNELRCIKYHTKLTNLHLFNKFCISYAHARKHELICKLCTEIHIVVQRFKLIKCNRYLHKFANTVCVIKGNRLTVKWILMEHIFFYTFWFSVWTFFKI